MIKDDFINNNFILANGKESLSIIALLSRKITLRYKIYDKIKYHNILFYMRYLFDGLKIKNNNQNQKDNIVQSLKNLVDYGVFKGKLNKTGINDHIELTCKLIKNNFTIITDREFDLIFEYNKQRIDNFNLFNTYLVIKKFSNNDTKESYPSIEYIMSICNISSNNSILKYINILIELKLINCERGIYYTNTYGEVKKSNNIYTILN